MAAAIQFVEWSIIGSSAEYHLEKEMMLPVVAFQFATSLGIVLASVYGRRPWQVRGNGGPSSFAFRFAVLVLGVNVIGGCAAAYIFIVTSVAGLDGLCMFLLAATYGVLMFGIQPAIVVFVTALGAAYLAQMLYDGRFGRGAFLAGCNKPVEWG